MFDINWFKTLFLPKDLKDVALDKHNQLHRELFEAYLAHIQWKNSIESKKQQLQYIESFLKDHK